MRKSRFIEKFTTIVILFMFVINITVLVQDIAAAVYVKAVTSTGTEEGQGFDWWIFKIPTLFAFAKAEVYPRWSWRNETPGIYSGYASVSATVGDMTEEDSGIIWVRITPDGDEDSSGGYSVKVTGDEDASTSAFASGHIYEN